MATGILRIQAFAARQSAPVEGVTVNIVGDGFTAARMTDAEGNAADVTLTAPDCALSLEEDNTTRLPYAVCSLTASKAGYRTVRIQGIQVFAGQVTLAQPEMIPETEEGPGRGGPAHRHPAPPAVCGRRGQRQSACRSVCAPCAGPGHHPEEHHGPSGQTGGLGPERDRLVPQVYRQRGVQRSLPDLAGTAPCGRTSTARSRWR